jgi:hypothetical protein
MKYSKRAGYLSELRTPDIGYRHSLEDVRRRRVEKKKRKSLYRNHFTSGPAIFCTRPLSPHAPRSHMATVGIFDLN